MIYNISKVIFDTKGTNADKRTKTFLCLIKHVWSERSWRKNQITFLGVTHAFNIYRNATVVLSIFTFPSIRCYTFLYKSNFKNSISKY